MAELEKRGMTIVPISLIEQVGEERAFEQETGFDRCHIVSIRSEESAACGEEQTQEDLVEQHLLLKSLAEAHYATCGGCRQVAKRRKAAQP